MRGLVGVYANVYVCTGPLFLPHAEADGNKYVKYQVVGPHAVAVPTHYFKVIAGEKSDGTVEVQAFIMPNAPIPSGTSLAKYIVPLQQVEEASGTVWCCCASHLDTHTHTHTHSLSLQGISSLRRSRTSTRGVSVPPQ